MLKWAEKARRESSWGSRASWLLRALCDGSFCFKVLQKLWFTLLPVWETQHTHFLPENMTRREAGLQGRSSIDGLFTLISV